MIGHVIVRPDGVLQPADDDTAAYLRRAGAGQVVRCELRRARNYRFFRKWWSLINFAFDVWCERGVQAQEYRGAPVSPNKKRFRKDVTILAGYYEPVYGFDGSVRLEAKSISFESMSEEEFRQLYDSTIDVLLHKVIPHAGLTEESLRDAVNEVARYAA